jgi:hypothetical protein
MMPIMRMRCSTLTIAYYISAMFEGLVITEGFGKLYVIDPVFSIDCGGLGTPFLTHLLIYVKRSFMVLPCLG